MAALLRLRITPLFISAMLAASMAAHAQRVPVPTPRPDDTSDAPSPAATDEAEPSADSKTDAASGQTAPVFTIEEIAACEAALRKRRVLFTIGENIKGEAICGVERPVLIERLSDGTKISGAPVLNCATALAFDRWVSEVTMPAARLYLQREISQIAVSTSYQCRRRNNQPDGKFSEHAFGNGIDIAGFSFIDGSTYSIAVPDSETQLNDVRFQAAIRGGACAIFTTVLGPGSNAAHSNHLHMDMARRNGGYRLCE